MAPRLLLMLGLLCRIAPAAGQPVAACTAPDRAKATATLGHARFTVLTPAMLRMEWSPDGVFEDRPTLAFIHRDLPVPPFEVRVDRNRLTLITGELILRYTNDGRRFDERNLFVEFETPAGPLVWRPGQEDTGNLHGTTRTLDGVSGPCLLEPGLLSRDGWVVVDDSAKLLLEGTPAWIAPRADTEVIDWYFLGYGREYVRALADYAKIGGPVPLPPRYAFGAWWSRYWAYTDAELKDLVRQFREHDIPLDVLVVDMDWHLDGWTGYTWNPKYFPDPDGFLKWVHEQGLRTTLNLHPADGVGRHEAAFPKVAEAIGASPDEVDRIPFDCTDPKYMGAYFRLLHHPLEKQGVDFWWIDWQQGRKSKLAGLDPLMWLNHLHWTDMERRQDETGRRPLLFSRWGGLGNHRYQIGFSGDTFSNWESLAFQPYFTSTAGNVCYAFWSHDIGGHMPGPIAPELYVRWIQWGAFSPILRTHTTKNPLSERRIWAYPAEYFEAARKAFHLRYELLPYIYTSARKCYDTAIPLCRPLYYEWPNLDEAYEHGGEYLFGDQMLVCPVTGPADALSGRAQLKVWFPPGEWTSWFTGQTCEGPGEAYLLVPLDEIPVFVHGGGIIPAQPKMSRTAEKPVDPLILNIFPGPSGEFHIYEDDGLSAGYQTGQCAWTPVRHRLADGGREVCIDPVEGGFAGMPAERSYELRLRDMWPPASVDVDGNALPTIGETDKAGGWFYDRSALSTVVRLPARSVQARTRVTVHAAAPSPPEKMLRDGLRGRIRLRDALLAEHGLQPPSHKREGASQADARRALNADAGTMPEEMDKAFADAWMELGGRLLASNAGEDALLRHLICSLGLYRSVSVSAEPDGQLLVKVTVARTAGAVVNGVPLSVSLKVAVDAPWRVEGSSDSYSQNVRAPQPLVAVARLRTDEPERLPGGLLRVEITYRTADSQKLVERVERAIYPSINAWWVLGPVDPADEESMSGSLPQQERLDVQAQYKGKEGKQIAWREVARETSGQSDLGTEFHVDFDEVFGARVETAVAYAMTYLIAAEDTEAILAFGSDDGGAIWLNGREVHRVPQGRAYLSKQDRVPVRLVQGVNVLLVKIDQGGGEWGFSMHVETPDGKTLTQVRPSLKP